MKQEELDYYLEQIKENANKPNSDKRIKTILSQVSNSAVAETVSILSANNVKGVKGIKGDNRKIKFTKKEITNMPRLKDFKIRKKGKCYEIRFRRYGYNKSFSSNNLEVAKQKAFDWLMLIEDFIKPNKKFVITETEELEFDKNITFEIFANGYLHNYKEKKVKPITFKNYLNKFKEHIMPVYGKLSISKIRPLFIQEHLTKLNAKSPRACEDVKMLLNNVFDYAVNNGVIDRNPVKAVYIPKHERVHGTAFTMEEERKFLDKIKGTKFELPFVISLYTGARPTEIETVKINEGSDTLTIKNSKLKITKRIITGRFLSHLNLNRTLIEYVKKSGLFPMRRWQRKCGVRIITR